MERRAAPSFAGVPSSDRCPVCRARIVVMTEAEALIRNAILRVDRPSGRVTAKCGRCKAWVEVPLRFTR